MLKISLLNLIKTFLLFSLLITFLMFSFLTLWNQKPYMKDSFQIQWNQAYISWDVDKLQSLYKLAWDKVSKNTVKKCEKDGFYNEVDTSNVYFCRDNTIFIFAWESLYKSFLLVIQSLSIWTFITTLFISLFLTISAFINRKISYLILKNKSLTLSDVEKKFKEVVYLYKNYVDDIKNFDNNIKKNTDAIFNYAITYHLVSKRHDNEILNMINEISSKIKLLWLDGSFEYFFYKKTEFETSIIKKSKTYNVYETFFKKQNSIISVVIISFLLIYLFSIIQTPTLNIFPWKIIFIDYYSIWEGLRLLFSTDHIGIWLLSVIFWKIIIIYLIFIFLTLLFNN